jgi:hypothetical protein
MCLQNRTHFPRRVWVEMPRSQSRAASAFSLLVCSYPSPRQASSATHVALVRSPASTLLLTDRVLSGWTAERSQVERLPPTQASFCRPEALAPTPGMGR